mgnify:CR=1 FL=1
MHIAIVKSNPMIIKNRLLTIIDILKFIQVSIFCSNYDSLNIGLVVLVWYLWKATNFDITKRKDWLD